jgi:hypothetical protein
MRLEIAWSDVANVVAGARTRLADRTLDIDVDVLGSLLESDARLSRVRIDLAHPGESCRIARVFDVFAPRAKEDGGEDFPGVVGALARVGSGRTRAVANVAVVVTDQQIDSSTTLTSIDMSGPAALLSPFARTHNVVISAMGGAWHGAPGLSRRDSPGWTSRCGVPRPSGTRRHPGPRRRVRSARTGTRSARARASSARRLRLPDQLAPAADRGGRRHPLRRSGATDAADHDPSQRDPRWRRRSRRWPPHALAPTASKGRNALDPGQYDNVHRGYDTTFVKQDPHRLVPVDVAREMEKEGAIGKLHETVYSTTGVATTLAHSERMGREIAEKLRAARVDAVILTST